jgi:hypothetical protein
VAYEYATWRFSHAHPGDTVYLFSPRGLLNERGALTLPPGWAESVPVRYNNMPWYKNWVRSIIIPPAAAAGTHTVSWTGGDSIPYSTAVTVTAAPAATPMTRLPLGSTAADINAAINARGNRLVRFAPGTYYVEVPIYVADPSATVTLDGEGAVRFVRVPDGSSYGERMFSLDAAHGTINARGITFKSIGYDGLIFHAFPGAFRRLDVIECVFEQCRMMQRPVDDAGTNLASVLIRRCQFRDGAGTGDLPNGSVLDWCEFHGGTFAAQHSYFNNGADRILTMNCDWDRTSRGTVTQQSSRGCLIIGCRFFNIGKGEACAGEVMLWEGPPGATIDASYNAAVSCHAYGCTGPGVSLFGNGIHHNTFWDLTLGCRENGILVAQLDAKQAAVHDNTFMVAECDGSVSLSGKSSKNSFFQVICRDLPASCGNQESHTGHNGGPNYYRQGLPFVDNSTAQDNTFTACYVAVPRGKHLVEKRPGTNAWGVVPKTAD